MEATYATGAIVSAKSRFKDNRQKLHVSITKTQTNLDYWRDHLARDEVRTVLKAKGFNSYFKIIKWT